VKRWLVEPPRVYHLKSTSVPDSDRLTTEPNLYPSPGETQEPPTFVFPNCFVVVEAAVTTAVAAELAGLDDPDPLLATTETRNVCPTSAAATTYDCPVAPATATQPAPELSHADH
jgi:hypothetical protein